MSSTEMPPVPTGLQQLLRNYPDHIKQLQEVLVSVIQHPASGVPPFERAIWALEGRLETFISTARRELEVAREAGDPESVRLADEKLELMFGCRSSSAWGDSNLMDYFGYPSTGVRYDI